MSGGARARASAAATRAERPGVAGPRPVDGGALRGVAEQLPRLVDPDHPLLRLGIGRDVGVVLPCQPAVGRLDHLELRLGIDLEDLVRIGHAHGRLNASRD